MKLLGCVQSVMLVENTSEYLQQDKRSFQKWLKVQVKRCPVIFVKYKKDKKCIKPVLIGYGSNAKSLVRAAFETYEKLRKELEEQGHVVAPLACDDFTCHRVRRNQH